MDVFSLVAINKVETGVGELKAGMVGYILLTVLDIVRSWLCLYPPIDLQSFSWMLAHRFLTVAYSSRFAPSQEIGGSHNGVIEIFLPSEIEETYPRNASLYWL